MEVYFTTPEYLTAYLRKVDKEMLINCFVEVLHLYANDVNSSTLRAIITLAKAGYKPSTKKLGYNGESSDGVPCDAKPLNIRSDSGNKLNGGGNFSDFTYERLERYLADKVMILVSGFVDGQLVYILQFPFHCLEKEIRRQLDNFFKRRRRPGEYLRSASFSFKHYKNSPELQVVYKAPDLNRFKSFLTKDLFELLRSEEWRLTQL